MKSYYTPNSLHRIETGYYIKETPNTTTTEPQNPKNIFQYLFGNYKNQSQIKNTSATHNSNFKEIGPIMNFKSPWCTNALDILKKCNLSNIDRIEKTFLTKDSKMPHDKMTQMDYSNKRISFDSPKPQQYRYIDDIEKYNQEMSLSLDKNDVKYYETLFKKYQRQPTDIELYDLAQSNSEHSRHSFFNGILITRNTYVYPPAYHKEHNTLMDYIKLPLQMQKKHNRSNSYLAFCDNASAIKGFKSTLLIRQSPSLPSKILKVTDNRDIVFTAETHNFPTSIAPFPGATTGTGGRIRDNQAIGRGGLTIAGTAGYCVGNLCIPNYIQPWESTPIRAPSLATPLDIIIQASNGASDYGNKFGEPIIQGFARSYGDRIAKTKHDNDQETTERIEWLKPIMFTGGLGMAARSDLHKKKPSNGMMIIRLGGPAYRIGMGGGSASSRDHSEEDKDANFNAVQRGDAEMANKVNRVLKSCIEMKSDNPIISIHDQGAGGTANVTKEIIYPNGAQIDINKIISGDDSLSVLEKWVCEYQEQVTILVASYATAVIKNIAKRENCPMSIIGHIDNSKKIRVKDGDSYPVDLELEDVLGKIPQKNYFLERNTIPSYPLKLPENLTIKTALNSVFKLMSVGSKRFLTNKVDRSVTGLIAQQQCVGPLHTPLANVAVTAQSYYDTHGAAMAIGEQPLKGLANPAVMARMSIGEMITNIMWAKISSFSDIKCSGNWMWPGKDELEGFHLLQATKTVSETLIALGISIDGGKDSMSMKVNTPTETIKSPKSFVISGYAPCTDIRKTITPDLKKTDSYLFFVDLANNQSRLGGSALAQVLNQVGNEFPDIDLPLSVTAKRIRNTFNVIQQMIGKGEILSGHDRSDGGLITCILEMCMAGNKGCQLDLKMPPIAKKTSAMEYLFAEELGFVIEVESPLVISQYINQLPIHMIGRTTKTKDIQIKYGTDEVLNESLREIRNLWELTSFELEKRQTNPDCVAEELINVHEEAEYNYHKNLTLQKELEEYNPPKNSDLKSPKPKIAILREEGSNGDAEMTAAFEHAGFETWDLNMNDFKENENILDKFRGIAFVGGFSYADVFGAAKGWAATIKFNPEIKEQFDRFYEREDTFSLGVCNGCQLMAELGWIAKCQFVKNNSERFESRFSTVKINKTNAIMLKEMENMSLGVWVAHGEGQYKPEYLTKDQTTIQYIDPVSDTPTMKYPFNPNGSMNGITGVCSENGRHLAMMPHPERCFLKWQVPYEPHLSRETQYYPWFKMFINAYEWCLENN
jgi:phosphoribosylformylglycinamidine synthase